VLLRGFQQAVNLVASGGVIVDVGAIRAGGGHGIDALTAEEEVQRTGRTRAEERQGPAREACYASPDALYRAEYRRLLRLLAAAARDPDGAADALQEAFVQLQLRWIDVRTYDNQVGWVMRVAINRLRNQERSLRRRASALLQLGSREQQRLSFPPPDAGRVDLEVAIGKLPPRRRLILALYYLEDRAVADIAALLGISEGSVTKQLHRAREALRRELGE
jgi:RNA polymerase sigma-70 factor (ECF subfamily)